MGLLWQTLEWYSSLGRTHGISKGLPPQHPSPRSTHNLLPFTTCSSSSHNSHHSRQEDSQCHPQVCCLLNQLSCHSLETGTVNHHLSWALSPWYVPTVCSRNVHQPYDSLFVLSHHHQDWCNECKIALVFLQCTYCACSASASVYCVYTHVVVFAETPQPTGHAHTLLTLLPTWSRPHGPFPLSPSPFIPTQTNPSTRTCLRCRPTVFPFRYASTPNGWGTPHPYRTAPTSTASCWEHSVILYKYWHGILVLRSTSPPAVCAATERKWECRVLSFHQLTTNSHLQSISLKPTVTLHRKPLKLGFMYGMCSVSINTIWRVNC